MAGLFYSIAEGVDFLLKKLGVNFSILGSLGKAWDYLTGLLGSNKKATEEQADASNSAVNALNGQATAVGNLVKATADQIAQTERLKDAYQRVATAQETSLQVSNQLIGSGELQRNLVENLRTSYEAYLNQRRTLEQEIQDLTNKGSDQERAKIPLLKTALAELEQRYQQNAQSIRDLTFEQERLTAARGLDVFGIKQQQDNADQLLKIQRDLADLGLGEIEKKYVDITRASEDSARAAIRAEEARRGGIALSAEEIDEYYARAARGNDKLREQTGRLFERSRQFSTGWNRAFREYADNATNAARTAENLFKKATQGMEDAIVNFAKTGKFEWKNFVNMMLEELLRAQIQSIFAQMLGTMQGSMRGGSGGGSGGGSSLIGSLLGGIGSLFGGGSKQPASTSGGGSSGGLFGTIGNIFSGAKNLFSGFFANGGTIPQGRFGIVGERGPEFVGGPASVTPMTGTNVTYNINAVDARSFQQLLASNPGLIYALTEQGRKSVGGAR